MSDARAPWKEISKTKCAEKIAIIFCTENCKCCKIQEYFGNEIPWVVKGKVEAYLPKKKRFLCPIETFQHSRKAELDQNAKKVALKSLKFVHPDVEGLLQLIASSNLERKPTLIITSLEQELIANAESKERMNTVIAALYMCVVYICICIVAAEQFERPADWSKLFVCE